LAVRSWRISIHILLKWGLTMFGLEAYILAFIRFSTFIAAAPIFSQRGIPPQLKIGLAALLSLATAPQVSLEGYNWVLLIVQEIGIGLILAFAVMLVFAIIYFAGQLVDVPMGFGMATIFDPQTGIQMPIFSQFYYFLAVAVLLAVDGHLWIIRALAQSFEFVPVSTFFDREFSLGALLELSKNIFGVGLQIAAPIMGTMVLVDVALGVITRVVPQLNVFVLGFPIKILMGMLIVILAVPVFISIAAKLFGFDGLLMEVIMGLITSGS
jgi:flagellar biosynthetic protein FliR